MQFEDERKELVSHFSSRGRRARLAKSRLLVPKKYDDAGNPIEPDAQGRIPVRQIFDLTITEARFLKAWKENEWNFDAACDKAMVDKTWAKKFARSLDAENYRQEDERDEILAKIPDRQWITARYTSAALGLEVPTEDQKWGIDRVKEVIMPKTSIGIQLNATLQLPSLTPEQEAALRQLGDAYSTTADEVKKVA